MPGLEFIRGVIGPLSDLEAVDVSTRDFLDERGFIVQVTNAGTLHLAHA